MSASDRGRGNMPGHADPAAPAKPTAPSAEVPGDPYSTWLDRMQRARARHAAITRNLYTWSSYKNWAERVRDSWEDEPVPGGSGTPASKTPRR